MAELPLPPCVISESLPLPTWVSEAKPSTPVWVIVDVFKLPVWLELAKLAVAAVSLNPLYGAQLGRGRRSRGGAGKVTTKDIRIETDRLLLRLPRIEDFERYAELFMHPTAAIHIGGPLARHEAWRKFLQMPGAWAIQGFAMFAVVEKAGGRWLGIAGPWQPDGWPGTEVGYAFHPAWGQGYATEACTAAIDWAFDNLGWTEVIHCISPDTHASQGVARRLGSVNRGPGRMPEPLHEHAIDIWAQTREQWQRNRTTTPL